METLVGGCIPEGLPQGWLKSKQERWRAQGDDSRTFLADFVAALPQNDSLLG
jgi:hypothetical protein